MVQTKKTPQFPEALGDSDWIRTNGPHLRRMTLYPAELPNHLVAAKKQKKKFLTNLIILAKLKRVAYF
jgi:hypothetical protein